MAATWPRAGRAATWPRAARHPLALLAAGIAVAVATAGCATTVTGTPRAATTYAPPSSSATDTAAVTTAVTTTSSTPASAPSSAPVLTSSAPPESSGIRPMPPLGSSGATDGTGSSGAAVSSTGTIAGVDLGAVLRQLDKTHVASVDSTADIAALTSVVDGARSKGLDLAVVSIGRQISNDDTGAIARQLFASTGGTLVVLSPTLISARSDQLTDDQRDAAIKAAADSKDDVGSVTKFVQSALQSTGLATTTINTTTTKTTATAPATVNGVDINAMVALLGTDHIGIQKGVTGVTAAQVRPEVQKAWKAALKVYVAFLAKDPSGHLYDISSAVMDVTGGTVIVLSPKRYAISSETISNSVLQKALDAAADKESYSAMVTTIIESLLSS